VDAMAGWYLFREDVSDVRSSGARGDVRAAVVRITVISATLFGIALIARLRVLGDWGVGVAGADVVGLLSELLVALLVAVLIHRLPDLPIRSGERAELHLGLGRREGVHRELLWQRQAPDGVTTPVAVNTRARGNPRPFPWQRKGQA